MTTTSPNPPLGSIQNTPTPDRLGPALLVAASLILAIRTARWPRERLESLHPEWQAELEQSVAIAHRIFAHLDAKSPFLFRRPG